MTVRSQSVPSILIIGKESGLLHLVRTNVVRSLARACRRYAASAVGRVCSDCKSSLLRSTAISKGLCTFPGAIVSSKTPLL